METYRGPGGKLWHLQHNCGGDTTAHHQAANEQYMYSFQS